MKTILTTSSIALLAASLAACVLITPAPGADKVRMTEHPEDVVSCKAVGNIDPAKTGNSEALARNLVVGDGGDTLLRTQWPSMGGVAYRCAKE